MFEKSAKFLRAEDDIKILLRLKQVAHLRVLLQVKSKVLTCAEISDTVLAVQEISEVNSRKPQFSSVNHIVGGHYNFYVYRELSTTSELSTSTTSAVLCAEKSATSSYVCR